MKKDEFEFCIKVSSPFWLRNQMDDGDIYNSIVRISKEVYPSMNKIQKRSFVLLLKKFGLERIGYYGPWDFDKFFRQIETA